MKNVVWELSNRLVTEQRYLALKDSPKFQHRMGSSSRQGSRYIGTLIKTTYGVTAASMLTFSTVLVFSDFGVVPPLLHIQSMALLLYSYIFLISLYSVLMFTNIIRTYHLFEPLKILPREIGHQILPLTWFIYNGSPSLFAVIPLLVGYAIYSGNYSLLPLGIIWAFLVMGLGYIAGILIVSVMAGKATATVRGRFGALSNIFRIAAVLLFFILFEIAIQTPQNIPLLPLSSGFSALYLVPILNISYISYPTLLSPGTAIAGLAITALYAIAIGTVFLKLNSKVFRRITEPESLSLISLRKEKKKGIMRGFYRNIFFKEVRNIFRKTQNATMMLIPVFLVLPTLLSIFFFSSSVSFGSISVYYSLLSIVIVSASFYPIALIISEGNGISVIQSLPLRLNEIIYSKGYVGAFIFAIIMIPVSVLFLSRNISNIPIIALLPANLITAYVYTSLYNLRRLITRIPRGSTTVNFYSFGGNLALFSLFGISAVFTAIPVVASTVLSYVVLSVPFDHPLSFYLTDLALNLALLFFVMNMVNKTK